MRFLPAMALIAVPLWAFTPGAAQTDPDKPVAGGRGLPSGWYAQTDWSPRSNSAPPLESIKFVTTQAGHHVTLGPAAIFWRRADTVSGTYQVAAWITQTTNPQHPEAYGVFIGGRDLAGEGQAYTYFLVRAYDGMFSIRRRDGQKTRPTAVVEWTSHDAVTKADAVTGRATNELSILVQSRFVTFTINGIDVHTANVADLDSRGIAGYRVNHNLDVYLGPLTVRPLKP